MAPEGKKLQPRISFSPLASSTDASFDDFFRIYRESLAVREQKSRALISAMLQEPDYYALLMKAGERIAGFSIMFVSKKESFCLLEYMAVDENYRNAGLGRLLFLQSVENVYSRAGKIPVLLEVDSDREAVSDQVLRRRRQEFYRRLDCRRIDRLAYILPLPGEGKLPEMDLMVYFPEAVPVIKKSQLKQWLQVIYRNVYGCAIDDPRIFEMLRTVTEPLRLI